MRSADIRQAGRRHRLTDTAEVIIRQYDAQLCGKRGIFLVQYTLAVDRGNANISYLYNHFNPAVLRLVQRTISSARENGIWAGMCGEMASDPNAAVLLMAMGISELSMSAPSIPRVKEKIRSISSVKAKEILADVMAMEDGDDIRNYLQKILG